jgi:hypothetical protein
VLGPGGELDDRTDELSARAPELAECGTPLALVALTTHARHPLGAAVSRLLIARSHEGATIRDIGVWDPLPLHLRQAYDHGGHEAQVEFWSPEPARSSMLAQLARLTA